MSVELPSMASWPTFQNNVNKKCIQLQMVCEPYPAESIIKGLSSIKGPLDVYFWYEGTRSLPKLGAQFMTEQLFKPLYKLKQDIKLCLYSLKAWNFSKVVSKMPFKTPLGEAISSINSKALECIYSFSFFQFCAQPIKQKRLYTFLSEELPKKEWLVKLSSTQQKKGITVGAFFNNQSSLFDCIAGLKLSCAYSAMQYVEAYYLVQESVKKGLANGQKRIEIVFVLPNDESKYYVDLAKDIESMLELDFGKALLGIEVNITFHFFQYGNSESARPYIDIRPNAPEVNAKEVGSYFDFLSQQPAPKEQFVTSRDDIHNLNKK